MPIDNIYNAAYSLQVRAALQGTPSPAAPGPRPAKLCIGWGVSGTRNSSESPWGSSRHLKNNRCRLVPVPSIRL